MRATADSGHRRWPRRLLCALSGFLLWPARKLVGPRILVYQHSAVGRDLLAELLARLGAEVISAGRSENFVPIDTENIDAAQLDTIQKLADEHNRTLGRGLDRWR